MTAPGFTTFEETDIPVVVAETSTHDVKMTLGSMTSSVKVTANNVALNTTSATLGTVVAREEVTDLPLNGRNFTELLLITAGVTSAGTDASWGNPQSGDYRVPSINGQSQATTTYLLDWNEQHLPIWRRDFGFAGGRRYCRVQSGVQC